MAVYKLFWDEFSSWYLEIIKPSYGQAIDSTTYKATLFFFDQLLKLLHPFMPFITEELWQQLYEREEGESIMVSLLISDNNKIDETFISQFETVKEIIGNVRTVRLQKNIAWKETLELHIIGCNPVEKLNAIIAKMCNLSTVTATNLKANEASSFIVGTTEFAVPLDNLIDEEAEITRMEAELKHKEEFLQGVWKKLNNEKFITNASPAVLEMERKKQTDAESIIKSLKESIDTLKKSL
jgi:valyl-tRNA synthetase